MDKLQEPQFESDHNWKRLLLGTEPVRNQMDDKAQNLFLILSGLSVFRYVREVTFYKKNYFSTLFICSGFILSSYNISKFFKEDSYVVAAEENNKNELNYIREYKNLFIEARDKKLELPQNLIE